MAILDPNRFAHLTPDERLRRIGDLLAKAVMIFRQRERAAGRLSADGNPVVSPVRDITELVTDPREKEILRYLQRVGVGSPHDLRVALDTSESTVKRALVRLRSLGLVVASGHTRAVRYRLPVDPGRS
ncbi:MAG: hypothetical protein ACOZE5_17150 [Verrucomicrobiota bacterium]